MAKTIGYYLDKLAWIKKISYMQDITELHEL